MIFYVKKNFIIIINNINNYKIRAKNNKNKYIKKMSSPSDENAEIEAAKLKTDELNNILTNPKINYDSLFSLITSSTNYDRQIMVQYYDYKYKKNLFEVINKLFSSHLKDILTYFFYSPYELDARILNKSLHSFRKDEKAIIEIFVSRPQWYLQQVDQIYETLFKTSLKKDLEKEKKNDFYIFLRSMMDTPRDEKSTIFNEGEAESVANEINEKGMKNYGCKVDLFKNLFVKRSREDFIKIARAFKKIHKNNKTILDVVDAQVGSKTRGLIKGIIEYLASPSNFFAQCLKKSIVGLGTDNSTLNRVLVSRFEVDMSDIRDFYQRDTGRTLIEDIEGDTSGEYCKFACLLANK